jgi:two-component system LytT family sensor kinase
MAITKKYNLWYHIKGVLIVTFIGTSISLLFSGFDSLSWRQIYYTLLYSFLIGSTLWTGNISINPALDKIFKRNPLSPGHKLIYSLSLMMIVSGCIIVCVNWFFYEILLGHDFWAYVGKGSGLLTMIIQIVVVVIIALVLYTQEFFNSWRDAVKNEEALKRDKLALQYEALKNQVNPHFLFNSLNTLSGLINKDALKATRFVKELSDIYRYVLEQKDRELVSLESEMLFVTNYISLMKIRFGDNLIVDIDLGRIEKYKLIPLSIQMLVENAIKHNIVSSDMPLKIGISVNGNHQLVVTNNLQKKTSILHDESGDWEKHGLVNIKSRYEYLGKGVFIVNGSSEEPFPNELNGNFVVNVPLIS